MLTSLQSSILCFLSGGLYVLSLYLLPKAVRVLERNNGIHIRWRMMSCSLSTLIIAAIVVYFYDSIKNQSHLHHVPLHEALGLRFDMQALSAAAVTGCLMMVFYAGPIMTRTVIIVLYGYYHIDGTGNMTPLSPKAKRNRKELLGTLRYWIHGHLKSNLMLLTNNKMVSFRNHIFAPVSEELAFRSIMVLFMLAKYKIRTETGNYTDNNTEMAWEIARRCPLWFGVAHLHHIFDKVSKDRSAWKVAIAESLLQFAYTSIFGYIAGLLLLRTGTVLAPIVSHTICNLSGLPDVGFLFTPSSSASSTETSALHDYWIIVSVAHVGGLLLFAFLLCPLTETYAQSSALWIGRSHPIIK